MSEVVEADFLPILIVEDNPETAVRQMIEEAVALRAGDLFLSTDVDSVQVRIRHMGTVRKLHEMNLHDGRRCLNYIRTAADMPLTERRKPVDGRWVFMNPKGVRRDVLINSIPTLHGEDMALRILSRDHHREGLDDLGLSRTQLRDLTTMLQSPGGFILVTGPSGAGKTTTLYSCLHALNDGRKKLNTIEDPIECEIAGVRQSQVDLAIGLDFPELLRSVLRQAPDVILLGEIRDRITAQTAIRAANSGHLVIATMHAPVTVAAVAALCNYDVHPHFLASCLLGVISQRLVRVLCPECRVPIDFSASPTSFDEIRPWLRDDEGSTIYGPGGCSRCEQTGYVDRTGIFELLTVSPRLRRLIADNASDRQLLEEALKGDLVDFRRAGLLKVAQGTTSLEELFRVIPAEHLGVDDA